MVRSKVNASPRRGRRVVYGALPVLALLLCDAATAQTASEIRIARYTSTVATPELSQLDPLEAVVHLSFPRGNVQTVGDAIAYLLLRSGYRLQSESLAQPVLDLLSMPLPEVHRRLGPCSVRTALTVLAGKSFSMSVDASHRLVSFAGSVQSPADGVVAKTIKRPANGEAR